MYLGTINIAEDGEKKRIYSGRSKSYLRIIRRRGTFTVKVAPRRDRVSIKKTS